MPLRGVLLALTLTSLGCSSRPFEPSVAPERVLALHLLVTPNPIEPGEMLAGVFVVTNSASNTVHVCRTQDWGYKATAGIPAQEHFSSHLGCSDRDWVSIGAGRSVEWEQKFGTLPECTKTPSESSLSIEATACPGGHSLTAYVVAFTSIHERCSRGHPCSTVRLEATSSYTVR